VTEQRTAHFFLTLVLPELPREPLLPVAVPPLDRVDPARETVPLGVELPLELVDRELTRPLFMVRIEGR
jgi:hypothetical protein